MSILIDFADPRSALAGTGQTGEPGQGAVRCAFETPLEILIAHSPEQVKPLLDAVEAQARAGRWCVGYLSYEAASAFDAALLTHPGEGPLAWFAVFDQALPWPDPAPADAADNETTGVVWTETLSRAVFDASISAIHQAIAAGELYQVNYTAPLKGDFAGNPAQLFARLQDAQPGGYAAYINTGDEQILSVSPELFFDWDGQAILTRPMKGTAPRGETPGQDAALAAGLPLSPKERAENVMIVDLLRNDLSRIAEPFSVQVPALFVVQSLATVHQMVSDVSARTRPGIRLSDVFAALFPCGSITGAPKVRAMQMIRVLEPQARGVYCGAIGVIRPGGHATFNVAIRTVTLRADSARCGIGSGITADAGAQAEWQEWQHKRGFLERASQPFELLETLRLDDGVFHLLDQHLARLHSATRHFAYPEDTTAVRQVLQTLAQAHPSGCWRVRLRVDAAGRPRAEAFAHADGPQGQMLGLAARPFEAAHSEFSRFKTTRRGHYEAFAPSDPALFDTLLYNSAGELTECTRGNVAVLLDGQWRTPALHCGLLPGVGRAEFLRQGRLTEAIIRLDDLPRAAGLAFINSLRGWVAVTLRRP